MLDIPCIVSLKNKFITPHLVDEVKGLTLLTIE